MPINPTLDLIFVHIPKCGGTSVEKMLYMSRPEDYYTRFGIKSRSNVPRSAFASDEEYEQCAVKNLQHLTFKELSVLLDAQFLNSAKVFTTVRNPYTRIVSAYYFCKSGKGRCSNDKFITQFPTFASFVKTELDLPKQQRILQYDGHLETASAYLLNSAGNLDSIDKIYRFENISELMTDLSEYTSVEPQHARATEYDRDYAVLYSLPETVNKVKEFYAQDFELFNYDPDILP